MRRLWLSWPRRTRTLALVLAVLGALAWLLPPVSFVAVARVTLGLGLLASALGALLGALLALVAYATGRATSSLGVWIFESMLALPLLLLVALSARAGGRGFLLALLLLRTAQIGQRLLAEATSREGEPYLEGVRALGGSRLRLFLSHLGPDLRPTLARLACEGAALAAPLDLLMSSVAHGSGWLEEPVHAAMERQEFGPLLVACLTAALLGAALYAIGQQLDPDGA